jgi:hypothetical protein
LITYTGGHSNSQTFYLRIHLLVVNKNTPSIWGILATIPFAYLHFFNQLGRKNNAPSLFAVTIFAVLLQTLSNANYEGMHVVSK